tara:strand:+ start:202 stop:603 length:402 start_codon:yes stop_codon:yes gene_type:complete
MNSVNDFIKSIKKVLSPRLHPEDIAYLEWEKRNVWKILTLFIVIGFTLDYLFKSDDESCGRRSCGPVRPERRLSWWLPAWPKSVTQASAEWKRATWVPGGDAGRTVVAILVYLIILYAIVLIFKVFLRLFGVS